MVSLLRDSMWAPDSAAGRTAAPLRAPVLAIDYGRRRMGLAVSDALGLVARPLGTLVRTNRRDDLRRLRELAREHGVRLIVVGNPLHLDGRASEMGDEAARFAARVAQHLGIPVRLADERLSSWEAAQMLAAGHASTRRASARSRSHSAAKTKSRTGRGNADQRSGKTRGGVDDLAAAVILRDYLERAGARRELKD